MARRRVRLLIRRKPFDRAKAARDHRPAMGRRVTASVAALALVAASAIDNAASCRDDVPSAGGSHESVPVIPQTSCAGMPCQTPGDEQVPLTIWPVFSAERTLSLRLGEPASADAPEPPTPPPTAIA